MILDGQVAIVTGAGQGIGKAIAMRLAKEGADVAIIDTNEQTANNTAQAIRRLNRQSSVSGADVSNSRLVETAH